MGVAIITTLLIVGGGAGILIFLRKRALRSGVLAALQPGVRPLRKEHSWGDVPGSTSGRGLLALYADELIFVRTDGAVLRLPLGEISDVTRIRSIGSLAEQRDRSDLSANVTPPEWLLKVEWKADGRTVSASWAPLDADAWIAALAAAR